MDRRSLWDLERVRNLRLERLGKSNAKLFYESRSKMGAYEVEDKTCSRRI